MNVTRLYVNGCSWTAGDELELDPEFHQLLVDNVCTISPQDNWTLIDAQGKHVGATSDFYNRLNWPGRLAQKLKVSDFFNHATGGGSNDRIFRTTIEYIRGLSPEQCAQTLIVIGWTVVDRREIYLNHDNNWHRWNTNETFSVTLTKPHTLDAHLIHMLDDHHKDYITTLFSKHERYMSYFNLSFALSKILQAMNIRHLFFNALPLHWNIFADSDFCQMYEPQLAWQDNDNQNFLPHRDNMNNFVAVKQFNRGPGHHPLADGHRAWAEYIYEHLINRNIIKEQS